MFFLFYLEVMESAQDSRVRKGKSLMAKRKNADLEAVNELLDVPERDRCVGRKRWIDLLK